MNRFGQSFDGEDKPASTQEKKDKPVDSALSPPLRESLAIRDEFRRPFSPLGTLTPLPGSVLRRPIRLYHRWTMFGRDPAGFVKNQSDPGSWIQYPDKFDVRVPRKAFQIVFWLPGLEARIKSGKGWREHPGLFALIGTGTNLYIKVNDVQLRKGKDCWLYGRLQTGDIITIFGPKNGEVAPNGKAAESLIFRCDFLVGCCANVRDVPFVVEREVENFVRHKIALAQKRSVWHEGRS